MRWQTYVQYVHLDTGHVTATQPRHTRIVKTSKEFQKIKNHKYGEVFGVTQITKFVRDSDYKQPTLFDGVIESSPSRGNRV